MLPNDASRTEIARIEQLEKVCLSGVLSRPLRLPDLFPISWLVLLPENRCRLPR